VELFLFCLALLGLNKKAGTEGGNAAQIIKNIDK
jgi:hypothetical protein